MQYEPLMGTWVHVMILCLHSQPCFHSLITRDILQFRLPINNDSCICTWNYESLIVCKCATAVLCSYLSTHLALAWLSLDGLYALAWTEHKETDAAALMIMSHHAGGVVWCIMLSNHFRHSVNQNLYINFVLCLNSRCEGFRGIEGNFTSNQWQEQDLDIH
jgi:hypothetical protein